MSYNLNEILEIYSNETTITAAAKEYCKRNNIEYTDTVRRTISKMLNKTDITKDNDLDNFTETETNQYKKSETFDMPSAWSSELNRFLSIEEYCTKYGLDINSVKSSKLVSHNQSHMVYNIAFYTPDEEMVVDIDNHLEEIVSKYIKPLNIEYSRKSDSALVHENPWFDRLVYTDTHLAMNVNGKDGAPLYDGKWDKEEALKRLQKMIKHVIDNKKGDTLFIDEMGDFFDGLGGQTTRGGHDLPQNMSDADAFDLGLEFKITLVDSLVPHYDYIVCNDVTNDNHSGVFAYFASSATKQILEQRYPGVVTVIPRRKFMEHYSVGKHTFILTHGKDSVEQKHGGFKAKLDDAQIKKIDQYCKEHKLYNGNYIELSKGNDHQGIYDDTTSNDFQYYSYPAFSPPSNWVKTNFTNSLSGFRFYNIHRDKNLKTTHPYFF